MSMCQVFKTSSKQPLDYDSLSHKTLKERVAESKVHSVNLEKFK
jgi:hypothetical protein